MVCYIVNQSKNINRHIEKITHFIVSLKYLPYFKSLKVTSLLSFKPKSLLVINYIIKFIVLKSDIEDVKVILDKGLNFVSSVLYNRYVVPVVLLKHLQY